MKDLENNNFDETNNLFSPDIIIPILSGFKDVIETASKNEKEIELASLKSNEHNEEIQFKKLKEQLDYRKSEQNFEFKKFIAILFFFSIPLIGCFFLAFFEKPLAMELLKDLFLLLSGGFGGYGIRNFTDKKKP